MKSKLMKSPTVTVSPALVGRFRIEMKSPKAPKNNQIFCYHRPTNKM